MKKKDLTVDNPLEPIQNRLLITSAPICKLQEQTRAILEPFEKFQKQIDISFKPLRKFQEQNRILTESGRRLQSRFDIIIDIRNRLKGISSLHLRGISSLQHKLQTQLFVDDEFTGSHISAEELKEIVAWRINPNLVEPSQEKESSTKYIVNVPMQLWAGKTPEYVQQTLKAEGFLDEIIVFILVEFMGVSLTKAGMALAQGKIVDAKNHRVKAQKLLCRAKEKYSIAI